MKKLLRKWLGIEYLFEEVKRIDEKAGQARCYTFSEFPLNSPLEFLFGAIEAIEDKLGGKVSWEWENDPNANPPPQAQVRKWFIGKVKKK